jgi:acyl-homoserine-lactone acylase
MKPFYLFLSIITITFCQNSFSQSLSNSEINRLQKRAKQVTIIRDNWGIAHVYGKTDADAVFGMLYAQCEDDFMRVEMNYIEKLGKVSELKGKSNIYNDLEMRLLIDVDAAKKEFKEAKPWLKQLLHSYADGINYYLYKNPQIKPKLLKHFEPWFPLLWTDGSIGAISTADLTTAELKNFYSKQVVENKFSYVEKPKEFESGSNGFAIAPSKSATGNALLYINPHTTFYFRPEIHIVSQNNLNAYGAVTWGQFFIYQGFNEKLGWMHTSSNIDVADAYFEKVIKKNNKFFYEYDGKLRPLKIKNIKINYLNNNKIESFTFTTYATHHGPIMAERDGKWVSLKSFNRSVKSLEQSWLRTKTKSLKEFEEVLDLRANTSNNTVFADFKGNIAYWHGNFLPKRNLNFNWAKAVDGSTKLTDWQGLHPVSEIVHIKNPPVGWIQNCNSSPFSVSGMQSPKRENYPPYAAPDGENFRSINAVRLHENQEKYTLESLIKKGYDTKLSIFEVLLPKLFELVEKEVDKNSEVYNKIKMPLQELKNWDYYGKTESVATTLANEWAFKLNPIIRKTYIDQGELDQIENTKNFIQDANAIDMIPQLVEVIDELNKKWGRWQVNWGEINRFQRIENNLDEQFYDDKPSLPIAFGSVLWGSLPAFKSEFKNTKKRYGYSGNSFVCAVEFGEKVRAKTLLAGGNSGSKDSKHFFDQSENYQNVIFKDANFYDEDVIKNQEKSYHPGELNY